MKKIPHNILLITCYVHMKLTLKKMMISNIQDHYYSSLRVGEWAITRWVGYYMSSNS